VIRKRIKLSPEKAIFIFVDEVLPPTAALMSSIYEEHKDEDGFLYITYATLSPHAVRSHANNDAATRVRTHSARPFKPSTFLLSSQLWQLGALMAFRIYTAFLLFDAIISRRMDDGYLEG
jgi:hypothetical protein